MAHVRIHVYGLTEPESYQVINDLMNQARDHPVVKAAYGRPGTGVVCEMVREDEQHKIADAIKLAELIKKVAAQ